MESAAAAAKPVSKKKIPAYLIKEEYDGIPLYYKGYKEVLEGKKTLEDIMPSSSIHGILIAYLTGFLWSVLNHQNFWLASGEVGNLTPTKKRSGLDIAIFDKKVLTASQINRHFTKVPPKIVLEIDVDVESEDLTQDEIILFRTNKLIESGVEKIIWIFTLSKMIMVAEKGKDWTLFDWNREVEVMEGISFNLGAYLKNEGIEA